MEDLPHAPTAAPDLEAFVVLSLVKTNPGLRKAQLASMALEILRRKPAQERQVLVFIDSLLSSHDLYRHDFAYHLTPSGEVRLADLKTQLRPVLTRAM